MTSAEGSLPRTRPAPTAHCRLCSAVCTIDAPTTDQMRISLRRFMTEHRHEGLADIVIDISDDDGDVEQPREVDLDVAAAAVSGS